MHELGITISMRIKTKEIFIVMLTGALGWLVAAAASEFLSGDYRRKFEENERNKIIWEAELKEMEKKKEKSDEKLQ